MDSPETPQQELTSKFDGIGEALDVSTEIVKPEAPKTEIVDTTATKEQLKKDYEYTRGNLYSLIEKGQEAVDGILELAQESDQPRAYEVAGQLIKHVGDVADKLMTLQKDKKSVREEKKSGPTNVTNALFVGSTADLQKMLKDASKKKDK
jgi:hypothetical protein